LPTVISDDNLGKAEATDNILPYEILDIASGDCGKRFGLDPLGEIINADQEKLTLSLTGGEGADNIHVPLDEQPG